MSNQWLPDYYLLLREAFLASEALDKFDADTADPLSRQTFLALVKQDNEAQIALMEYVAKHRRVLIPYSRPEDRIADRNAAIAKAVAQRLVLI